MREGEFVEKTRLICLPYAGGSAASIYLSWKKKLEQYVEVIPLELAGRGKRIREPLFQSVDEAVDDLIKKNINVLLEGKPYSIFGHSMGGLLAYELCQKINEEGLPLPENLFVSAFQPPHIKLEGDIHLLPMNDFAEKMRKSGNIPETIFQDKDLYNLFIPILYADYKLVFQYIYKPKSSLMKNNLHIFTGNTDLKVYQLRKEWSRHTQGYFEEHVFEGGHFFIRESEAEVLKKIVSILLPAKVLLN